MAPKTPSQAGVPEPRTPQHADTVHVGATVPVRPVGTLPAAPVAAIETTAGEAIAVAAEPAKTAVPEATPSVATASSEDTKLPVSMVTRSDVGKSLRELDAMDDFFRASAIRGSEKQTMPAVSAALNAFATDNGLNFLQPLDRTKARKELDYIRAHAPVVHVAFASDPSGDFLMRLLDWFRKETHPFVLLHVGLQPDLAAGCTIRTTNKVFDFSFRARFENSKAKLVTAIESLAAKDGGLGNTPEGQAPVMTPATTGVPEAVQVVAA